MRTKRSWRLALLKVPLELLLFPQLSRLQTCFVGATIPPEASLFPSCAWRIADPVVFIVLIIIAITLATSIVAGSPMGSA